MFSSLLAEILATCLIFSDELPTSTDCFSRLATMDATDLSIPFLRSSGFAPAATFFRPSLTIAWAKIVAVVVPSPAKSFVLDATSLPFGLPYFQEHLQVLFLLQQ